MTRRVGTREAQEGRLAMVAGVKVLDSVRLGRCGAGGVEEIDGEYVACSVAPTGYKELWATGHVCRAAGEINRFVRNGVILQDGSFVAADLVLYCTGGPRPHGPPAAAHFPVLLAPRYSIES